MDSEKVIKRDNEYVLHTYNRNPIALEKGHGLYAEGPEGQKYLDFTSGIGVNSLGYCDLTWAEAVSEQAHKLQHTSNLYYTAPCGKLAKKLCKRTGMNKVFFGNSGAEANEGAIKAARKYSFDHYGKGRDVVITLVNSFHGRTIATLTATGQEVFHNYFGPFNEGFQYVKAGDIDALTEMAPDTPEASRTGPSAAAAQQSPPLHRTASRRQGRTKAPEYASGAACCQFAESGPSAWAAQGTAPKTAPHKPIFWYSGFSQHITLIKKFEPRTLLGTAFLAFS